MKDMFRHQTMLLTLVTVVLKYAVVSAKIGEDLHICRDLYGMDCERPQDMTLIELESLGFANDEDFFKASCCKLGGGEVMSTSNPIVEKIFESYENFNIPVTEAGFDIQGTATNRALFWLINDDSFGIKHYSAWLLQRYTLAVMFFRLGGAKRWKTCWGGSRIFVNEETNEFVQYQGNECNHDYLSGTWWLSSEHECHWAFIECDRNEFVKYISMVSNVLESTEEDSSVLTTKDEVKLSGELAFLNQTLQKIDLRGNHITGTIPQPFGSLGVLRVLNIYGNSIVGSVPDVLYNILGLEYLNLSKNNLSGHISDLIGYLKHLKVLAMSYNENITGSLPIEMKQMNKVETLSFNGLDLNGSVPSGMCDIITLIDISVDCSLDCEESCCSSCNPDLGISEICSNGDSYGWMEDSSAPIGEASNSLYGCDFVELHDDVGCPLLGSVVESYGRYPKKECCHCGLCNDYPNWKAIYGETCQYYEDNEPFGCPLKGTREDAFGISAHEACCWCNGGSDGVNEVPPLSPSPSQSFHPTAATLAPTTTVGICEDALGWQNLEGRDCSWFAKDSERCTLVSNENSTDTLSEWLNGTASDQFYLGTISVLQACCVCGGGINNMRPSESPSLSVAPSMTPTAVTCFDFPQWQDLHGNTCENFEENDLIGCPLWGVYNYSTDLIFAKQACCYCGGGIDHTIPSLSPTRYSSEENDVFDSSNICKDIQIARPYPEHDCEWFEQDSSRCEMYGDEFFYEVSSRLMSANYICCSCGGGTSNRINFPNWVDAHPETPYTCKDYEKFEECTVYGDGYVNLGHSANSACSVCGGGFLKEDVLLYPSEDDCIDEINWTDVGASITCEDFLLKSGAGPDVEKCLSFGHLTSKSLVNASTGCCNCRYGYDDVGGGYRGNLIGSLLRIAAITNFDVDYLFDRRSQSTKKVSGAHAEFMSLVASANGYGVIAANISDMSLQKYNNDTYLSCLNDLNLGTVDVCIGPFFDSNNLVVPTTSNLMSVNIFLVVRKVDNSFLNTFLSVTGAFTGLAWSAIIGVILLFGVVTDILNLGSCRTHKDGSNYRRVGNLVYTSTTLFIGKGSSTGFTSGPQKIAYFGFAIFCLFVISTFTGSITASLVNVGKSVEYDSLDAVISERGRICMPSHYVIEFLETYRAAADLIVLDGFRYVPDVLEELMSTEENNLCDVAVISSESYQSAARTNSDICDNLILLQTEIVLTLDHIVPINPKLGSIGSEFLSRTNHLISSGLYTELVESYASKYSAVCTDTINLEDDQSSSVDVLQIMAPAIFSVFCSCVAFYLYIRKKNEKYIHEEDGTNDSEVRPLHGPFSNMSSASLVNMLNNRRHVSKERLDVATQSIPDKSKLVLLANFEYARLSNELAYLDDKTLKAIISSHAERQMLNEDIDDNEIQMFEKCVSSEKYSTEYITTILSSPGLSEYASKYLDTNSKASAEDFHAITPSPSSESHSYSISG